MTVLHRARLTALPLAPILFGVVLLADIAPAAAQRVETPRIETRRIDGATNSVQREIDRLGIDRSRITSVYVAPDETSSLRPTPSYTGFISLEDCRGNIVIGLNQANAVRTLYATGDCGLPNS